MSERLAPKPKEPIRTKAGRLARNTLAVAGIGLLAASGAVVAENNSNCSKTDTSMDSLIGKLADAGLFDNANAQEVFTISSDEMTPEQKQIVSDHWEGSKNIGCILEIGEKDLT